jgi:pimeloyl-ACP methyl ester carboxylesterase
LDATGLLLRPKKVDVIARVVAIPDADWTPEMICGIVGHGVPASGNLESNDEVDKGTPGAVIGEVAEREAPNASVYALDFALMGCEVLVPTLISRGHEFSRNDEIGRVTNLSHREFIYRQAFEMGRHVIGYEVQKVLAAVDQFELRNTDHDVPCIVAGVSEGGLLAFYSAALDPRIDAAIVSGYFDQREGVWQEPIYRNVWGLLKRHGDAELAAMIAPRKLMIEIAPTVPEVRDAASTGRNVAAPGMIQTPNFESVVNEIKRARRLLPEQVSKRSIQVIGDTGQMGPPLLSGTVKTCLQEVCSIDKIESGKKQELRDQRTQFSAAKRQQQQLSQMVEFTQQLVRKAHRVRDSRFGMLDRSTVESYVRTANVERERIHEELFGKLPTPTMAANPRSRLVLEDKHMRGYEVVLDVYENVIAAGVLLLPKDLLPGREAACRGVSAWLGGRANGYYQWS